MSEQKRTFKGLLMEMKLSKHSEERIVAEETLVNMFETAVDALDRIFKYEPITSKPFEWSKEALEKIGKI